MRRGKTPSRLLGSSRRGRLESGRRRASKVPLSRQTGERRQRRSGEPERRVGWRRGLEPARIQDVGGEGCAVRVEPRTSGGERVLGEERTSLRTVVLSPTWYVSRHFHGSAMRGCLFITVIRARSDALKNWEVLAPNFSRVRYRPSP